MTANVRITATPDASTTSLSRVKWCACKEIEPNEFGSVRNHEARHDFLLGALAIYRIYKFKLAAAAYREEDEKGEHAETDRLAQKERKREIKEKRFGKLTE